MNLRNALFGRIGVYWVPSIGQRRRTFLSGKVNKSPVQGPLGKKMAHPSSEHEVDGDDVQVGEGAAGNAPLTRKEKRKFKKERKKAEKRIKLNGGASRNVDVYKSILGSDARPEVALTGCQQSIRYDDARDLVRWALTDDVVAPKWVFLKNKPLLSQVVMVVVPDFEPASLLSLGDASFPFLTSLPRATVRVTNRNAKPLQRAINKLLYCTVNNKTKSTKQEKDGADDVRTTDHVLAVAEGSVVQEGKERRVINFEPYLVTESLRKELGYPMPDEIPGNTTEDGEIDEEEVSPLAPLVEAPEDESSSRFEYLGLDCEICLTKQGLELARITLVDHSFTTVYDELVKPKNAIVDYCTKYSGITMDMLAGVSRSLEEVREDLFRQKIISRSTILVGHGLENDLRAMRLVHTNTVDTTVLYPHFRGLPTKNSLRYLTCKYLNRKIQSGEGVSGGGHDSAEDAIAALELALLIEKNGPEFGSPHKVGHHLFQVLSKQESGAKTCACIGELGFVKQHSRGETHVMPCVSNADIASRVSKLVVTGELSKQKRDFVFARFNYGDGATTDHSQMDATLATLESTMAPTVLFIIVLQGENEGSILLTMGQQQKRLLEAASTLSAATKPGCNLFDLTSAPLIDGDFL